MIHFVDTICNFHLHVCTYNVRTLKDQEREEELEHELKQAKVGDHWIS